MKPNSFATQVIRPRDQFEAWREWYQPVFDVISEQSTGDEFPAEIHLWKLGGVAVSRTVAPSIHIVRTKGHLRRDPVDHWVISYCARGAHLAKTADTELEVPARVPYLWSLGQEFLHERTHIERIQFLMRRDAFRDIAYLLDAACGSTLDTPLGHLLGDYMMALERKLPDVREADPARLNKAVGAIVAAAVAPSAERVAVAKSQIDLGRKERVRQAVRRHLRTPTLEPKTLSRLVGMSRSSLYRLFEDTGGVARYIQLQRLFEAQAVLSDPATTQSISAIAEDLCFADGLEFQPHFQARVRPQPQRGAVGRTGRAGAFRNATKPDTIGSSELRRVPPRILGAKPAGGAIRGIALLAVLLFFRRIISHRHLIRGGNPGPPAVRRTKEQPGSCCSSLFHAVVEVAKIALPRKRF